MADSEKRAQAAERLVSLMLSISYLHLWHKQAPSNCRVRTPSSPPTGPGIKQAGINNTHLEKDTRDFCTPSLHVNAASLLAHCSQMHEAVVALHDQTASHQAAVKQAQVQQAKVAEMQVMGSGCLELHHWTIRQC